MIRNPEHIAFRFLERQKKRTLLNILGVIMATALITGTGIIIESTKMQLVQNTINRSGYYHYELTSVTPYQAGILAHHLNVERSCKSIFTLYGILFETGDEKIPYRLLHLEQYDSSALDMLLFEQLLIEGRFPETPNEIAIDETTMKILGDKAVIGESLTLQTGFRRKKDDEALITSSYYPYFTDERTDRTVDEYFEPKEEKTYTITGFLKTNFHRSDNYVSRSFTIIDEDVLEEIDTVDVRVLLKEGQDFQQAIDELLNNAGIEKVKMIPNDRLLNLTGNSMDERINSGIFGFRFIVTLIILIATIAVIYNSFNISLIERISQLGVLRCTGASPACVRRIILTEAAIIGLAGIPFGVIAGLSAIRLVFKVADNLSSNILFEGIVLIVTPNVIISSVLICFIAVILSAFVPAIRAGRIPAMEAVRSTGMYSHNRKVKAGKRVGRKKDNFTLLMAGRNTQRNRKRFLITLFSMSISVILFVSFGGMLRLIKELDFVKGNNYPGILLFREEGIDPLIIDDLVKQDAVETFFKYREREVNLKRGDLRFTSLYKEHVDEFDSGDDFSSLQKSRILCYGDDAIPLLEQKLRSGSFDDPEKIVIINKCVFRNEDGKRIYGPSLKINKGDQLEIEIEGNKYQLEIGGIADQVLYEDYNPAEGAIDFIVSESLFNKVTEDKTIQSIYFNLKPGAEKTQLISRLEQITNTLVGYEYSDFHALSDEINRETSAISLFFYGFIIMIALIGSLNVVNTVSTNLLIRSSEFGIIRAVGYEKSGIRKLVFIESLILVLASLLIGSILGTGLWYLLVREMTTFREMAFPVPWREIFFSAAGLIIVILLSSWFPLKRIFKQSAMENIRFSE